MKHLGPVLLLIVLVVVSAPAGAEAQEGGCCAETNHKLDALSSQISTDMHRLQRELGALRSEIDRPGMTEILAGFGYICGLFGVAFFVAGRRSKE